MSYQISFLYLRVQSIVDENAFKMRLPAFVRYMVVRPTESN